jgi:hypothetical protein
MSQAFSLAFDPVTLGIAALVGVLTSLDDSGTLHTGAAAQYSAATGLSTSTAANAFGTGFGSVEYGKDTATLTSGLAKSIVSILDSTATTFGQAAGYQAATAFADDTSKDGAWGALLISKLGQAVVNWDSSRTSRWAPMEFADGTAGASQYAAALAASVRTALDQMDLPTWATQMLASLGDAPTLEQLSATVDQINKTETAIVKMGYGLAGFKDLSDATVSTLMQAAGGIDALAASAGTYYEAFYSQAEQQANTARQVADALGKVNLTMPATREGFRALVEQQMALGEAGAPAVAALLSVSGAFASVVPASEALAGAVTSTTSEIASSIAKLRADAATLQIDLLRAQGNTTGATQAQRSLDTAGMTAAEIALYDYNQTLREQIGIANAASAAVTAAANERASLEQRVLQLQGDTAALRAAELAALNPANRELQAYIYSLEDVATAAQAAAALSSQRAGLEAQILQLQGNTAAIRAAELAALDASLQPLQQRIYALQDEATAAQAAQADLAAAEQASKDAASAALAAAQSVATEYDGLWRQYLTAIGDTVALRKLDLAAINPANRALQEQVWALQDQKAAADQAAQAAQTLASAWAGITTSLTDEVKRIRGLMTGGAATTLEVLQAQFAIATGQARAGDQAAAQSLTSLSQSLLQAGAAQATSLVELQRMQALTANSLELTASLVGSTATTGAASAAAASAIGAQVISITPSVSSAASTSAPAYTLADMVADLRAELASLREEVRGRREEAMANEAAIATNTGKTARLLDKFDTDGLPATRA